MNSIPACNSYQHFKGECEKDTAAAYDVGARMQINSIPACNSYQHFKGECEKETAAAYDVGARMQIASSSDKESIPACNSYQHSKGECEKETAAAYDVGARMQINSIPACNSYQHFKGECEKETAAAYDVGARMQVASNSIPACNSYQHFKGECEKDTAAAYDVGARMQVASIPACDSFQASEGKCQKETVAAEGVDARFSGREVYARAQIEPTNVQVNSDPICPSSGCPEKKYKGHPVDYPVPDFGVDHDILSTNEHLKNTETKLGHEWTPKWDEEKEKFIVPHVDAEFKLLQLQKTSDPICSSAGCPETKKKGHPVDYPVANFGVDHDIISTQKHIADQEKAQNHKWVPQMENPDDSKKIQLKSDPICPSSGCPESKKDRVIFPIYPRDLTHEHTAEHVREQEKIQGTWKTPSDGSAVQIKTDVKLESKEQQRSEFASLK